MMCLPLRAAGWQMGFSIDKRKLRPWARERGGWDSADLQRKYFLKVSLDHAVPKISEGILRAKSLWELSFYCTIIHQLGKEVFNFPPILSCTCPRPLFGTSANWSSS